MDGVDIGVLLLIGEAPGILANTTWSAGTLRRHAGLGIGIRCEGRGRDRRTQRQGCDETEDSS